MGTVLIDMIREWQDGINYDIDNMVDDPGLLHKLRNMVPQCKSDAESLVPSCK